MCYQNKSADYKKNDELKNNLNVYYNNDIGIINDLYKKKLNFKLKKEIQI